MAQDHIANQSDEKDNGYSMGDFIASCFQKWWIFLIAIVVFVAIAEFYVLRQQPRYLRTEQVLIKDQDEGGSTDAIASKFASMGLGASSANVYNELITLQSPALMSQVVSRLGLDNDYILKGFPHGTTLYGPTLPFTVSFPNMNPHGTASFRMDIRPDGSAKLYNFVDYFTGKKIKHSEEIELRPGFRVANTPIGKIEFTPNATYAGVKFENTETLIVMHQPVYAAVERFTHAMTIDLADKDAEVIDLSIKDVNIDRAEEILRTLLNIYNQDWMNDKNKMALATNDFIDARLANLKVELSQVDANILDYKSEIKNPDLEESVRANLTMEREMSSEMIKTNNELGMARFVKDYLNDPAHKNSVIPVNTGIGNQALESQIADYNRILLQRNNLVSSSSVNNPLVEDYDHQLAGRREAIVNGMNTYVKNLSITVSNYESEIGKVNQKVGDMPRQAKVLLTAERQQKVYEELYLYLLQKKEENELGQTFTATNTRLITPPYGPIKPVAPKGTMILAVAFLMGLLVPGAIIYLKESMDTKVRSKHDLDNMSTPFAGEIPYIAPNGKQRVTKIGKLFRGKNSKSKELETVPVRVEPGNRDVLNESFRIVRSNIDFMIHHDNMSNIMMITSFNPGSGKSFVTFNLGASFAIKDKSVLIVDCDLRHGSSSQYVGMPGRGLSNYLTGGTNDWDKLVVPVNGTPNLYVMPIGHRPPNPAELLDNGRIGEMLKEASGKFDYIFLDCPPLDVVVDTQVLEKYADHTLFVVRSGLLEKSMIPEIDKMYKTRRFKHMCILLNGTEGRNSRYNTYGSSYYMSDF